MGLRAWCTPGEPRRGVLTGTLNEATTGSLQERGEDVRRRRRPRSVRCRAGPGRAGGAQQPRRLRLLAGLRGGRAHAYKRLIQANTPHILNELHLPAGASVGLGAAKLRSDRLTRSSPSPPAGRSRQSPPRPALDGTEHGGGSRLRRRRLSAPRAGARAWPWAGGGRPSRSRGPQRPRRGPPPRPAADMERR